MTVRNTGSAKTYKAATFLFRDDSTTSQTCKPPARLHNINYHRPLLLKDSATQTSFLAWFDSIAKDRQMPWRKAWLSPTSPSNDEEDFNVALAKRAYEVWVSEIMLQQTRVSVVIPYFNNWIEKWPTVEDLAAAQQNEVLAAWKGLGYYSRATRLHEAAQQIVRDMEGVLPGAPEDLLKIKGIGRYTAGAISSIAFGKAAPLLDGNVSRVLCRQLGIHGRVKDKKVEDVLWDVADLLVRTVCKHDEALPTSDIPGRWNQGLMELGSTICTPKPRCDECPLQATCHVYAEGLSITLQDRPTAREEELIDIEDLCHLCEPLELEEVEDAAEEAFEEQKPSGISGSQSRKRSGTSSALPSRPSKLPKSEQGRQRSLRDFAAFASLPKSEKTSLRPKASREAEQRHAQVVGYCSSFPRREPKKTVPEEQCIVCIIKRKTANGLHFLVEQRPSKGLLASLWQFPTHTIQSKLELTGGARRQMSLEFLQSLFAGVSGDKLQFSGEKGLVTHIFSHLKLQMHIHVFNITCEQEIAEALTSEIQSARMWLDEEGVDNATLSTGMKRCWEKVRAGYH